MNDSELASILQSLDAAIAVYRSHDGKLSAAEVSVKSMITILRVRVAEQLSERRAVAHFEETQSSDGTPLTSH